MDEGLVLGLSIVLFVFIITGCSFFIYQEMKQRKKRAQSTASAPIAPKKKNSDVYIAMRIIGIIIGVPFLVFGVWQICLGLFPTVVTNSNKDGTLITREQFNQIQNGMTYDEVRNIIGCEGEVMSEAGIAGEPGHMIMYKWNGEGSLVASANFTFVEGVLQSKAQLGLE